MPLGWRVSGIKTAPDTVLDSLFCPVAVYNIRYSDTFFISKELFIIGLLSKSKLPKIGLFFILLIFVLQLLRPAQKLLRYLSSSSVVEYV